MKLEKLQNLLHLNINLNKINKENRQTNKQLVKSLNVKKEVADRYE